MPGDWEGQPLGSPEEVRRKIADALPIIDWDSEGLPSYDSDEFSIAFCVPVDDPCLSFDVYVNGPDEKASTLGETVSTLIEIAERYDWYVQDHSMEEWLHHDCDNSFGWSGFQAYRDRVFQQ